MKTALLFAVSSALLAASAPANAYQADELQECFQICREMYPENGAARAACKQRCIFYPGKNIVSSPDRVGLPIGYKPPRQVAH